MYATIEKARDILVDIDKREEFDAKLKYYPDIYESPKHLHVTLISDSTDDFFLNTSITVFPLSMRRKKAVVDFNELALSDRDYACKSFLAVARTDDMFRNKLINNVALFFMFSIQDQFEIILIDYCRRINQRSAEFSEDEATILFTLNELVSKQNNYESGFVLACIKCQDLAKPFLTAYQNIVAGLSRESFLSLAAHFSLVAMLFIKNYHVSFSDMAYLIGIYPEQMDQLMSAYQNNLPSTDGLSAEDMVRLLNFYMMTLELFKDCKNSEAILKLFDDPVYLRLITILGKVALLLGSYISDSKTQAIFQAKIFNLVIAARDAKVFVDGLSLAEKDLSLRIIADQFLYFAEVGSFSNSAVVKELLSSITAYDEFIRIIKTINISILPSSEQDDFVDTLLRCPDRKDFGEDSFIFKMLDDRNNRIFILTCLARNPLLFSKLLSLDVFKNWLVIRSDVEKQLINMLMEVNTADKVSDIILDCFSDRAKKYCGDLIEMSNLFSLKDGAIVTYNVFAELYKKVDFLSEMLDYHFSSDNDPDAILIKFDILKQAANYRDKTNEKHEQQIESWFGDCVCSGTKGMITTLLVLYPEYMPHAIRRLAVNLKNNIDIENTLRSLQNIASHPACAQFFLTGAFLSVLDPAILEQLPGVKSKEKIAGYQKILLLLSGVKGQDSFGYDDLDETLKDLSSAIEVSGLDLDTVDRIFESLSATTGQDSLYLGVGLVSVMMTSPCFKLSEEFKKYINNEFDKVLLQHGVTVKPRPELRFLTLAERYIKENYATIFVEDLLEMLRYHPEKLDPVIKLHQLDKKISNARALQDALLVMSRPEVIRSFNNTKIKYIKIFDDLVAKFELLVIASLDDLRSAATKEKMTNFYSELQSAISGFICNGCMKEDSRIQMLLHTYPVADSGNLLDWLVMLSFSNDQVACDHLQKLISNERRSSNDRPIFACFVNYIAPRIYDPNFISVSLLKKLFIPEDMMAFIYYCVTEIMRNDSPMAQPVIDCLYIILSETSLALTLDGRKYLHPGIRKILDCSELGLIPPIILDHIILAYRDAEIPLAYEEITSEYGVDNRCKIIHQVKWLGFYEECRFETIRETFLMGRFTFFKVPQIPDEDLDVANVIKPGVIL